jgi:hypothetical protein
METEQTVDEIKRLKACVNDRRGETTFRTSSPQINHGRNFALRRGFSQKRANSWKWAG